MSNEIPLSVPCLHGNEWIYMKEALDTNWVSSVGPFVSRFESELARQVGVKHAIAMVNGTSALHIGLMIAGVSSGDEVVMSDLTFIAPANAVRYLGAFPTFVDAEPTYWQMDVEKLERFLAVDCTSDHGRLKNRHTGRTVKALLPVHILGAPCDMDPIVALARRYGLVVIEDATESLGAAYKDRAVGHLGDMACFSFNGNKIITTGGGGMLVTDNADWARRARYLTTQAKDDPLEFVHNEVGYNYRLTNVAAAIGCAQMEQLPAFIEKKRRIALQYRKLLATNPGLQLPQEAPWCRAIYWLYTIGVESGRFGMDSRALLRWLAQRNIQTRPLWQPMHLSSAHHGSYHTDCSTAESLNRRALSLPCSVGISEEDQHRVVLAIREANGRCPG